MRLHSHLLLAAALCFLPTALRAEDTPAAPVAIHGNPPPAPAPPAADSGEKPTARREDEDETAGMLARIKAYTTGKTKLANNITSLEKEIASLTNDLKERDKCITALTTENEKMRADLAAFGEWLETNGHTTAKQAAADPATAFKKAVGDGVSTEVRKIGIPAALVKTNPAASAQPATLADLEDRLKDCKSPQERQELLAANKKLILASN